MTSWAWKASHDLSGTPEAIWAHALGLPTLGPYPSPALAPTYLEASKTQFRQIASLAEEFPESSNRSLPPPSPVTPQPFLYPCDHFGEIWEELPTSDVPRPLDTILPLVDADCEGPMSPILKPVESSSGEKPDAGYDNTLATHAGVDPLVKDLSFARKGLKALSSNFQVVGLTPFAPMPKPATTLGLKTIFLLGLKPLVGLGLKPSTPIFSFPLEPPPF